MADNMSGMRMSYVTLHVLKIVLRHRVKVEDVSFVYIKRVLRVLLQ